MNTNSENPLNESESNIQPSITRRTFMKRTTASAVVTTLALYAFRAEAGAIISDSSYKMVDWTQTWFLKNTAGETWDQPAGTKPSPTGVALDNSHTPNPYVNQVSTPVTTEGYPKITSGATGPVPVSGSNPPMDRYKITNANAMISIDLCKPIYQ